ncbi:MAG: hypothetical protein EOO38_05995 [Cytophagaceae bacterium]|nr:MAG: hypothetical protein EOO38_05995 [Cytophagaceae bacterium]
MNKRQREKEWKRRFEGHPWKQHNGQDWLFCTVCGLRYHHSDFHRKSIVDLRLCDRTSYEAVREAERQMWRIEERARAMGQV